MLIVDSQTNEIAVEAARQHPNRFAILGNFPVDRPESRALVDTWKQRPRTRRPWPTCRSSWHWPGILMLP